ncbi:MAG: zf-HC2 domain-containing protein [Candidatus Neomarinimicrobiota bacterium]
MMNCYQFKNSISSFIEEDINFNRRKQFEEHLQNCPACKLLHARILQNKKRLASLPKVTVSDHFMHNLQNKILADRNARIRQSLRKDFSFKQIPSFAYGFAAALLAVVAVFFILQSQGTDSTNPGVPPVVQEQIDQQPPVAQPTVRQPVKNVLVADDTRNQIKPDSSDKDVQDDDQPVQHNPDFQDKIRTVKKQY